MRRTAPTLHLLLTLLLVVGLLSGAFGQTLVNALGTSWDVHAAPTPLSFTLRNPTTSPTNADQLTFRVTFTESVTGVDATDFVPNLNPPAALPIPAPAVTQVSATIYDVLIYGSGLTNYEGIAGLDFSGTADIRDSLDNPIATPEPGTDETYLVDNTNPTVIITQALGQLDPAPGQPVFFDVVFSEVIDHTTFTGSAITQGGDAPSPTWTIADADNDHQTFELSAKTSANGSIIPLVAAGRVKDLAGNGNMPFIEGCVPTDHCVTLADVTGPVITIEQGLTQPDPTGVVPVVFTIDFGEAINVSTFTTSDITQAGDASSPVWSITDTGDHQVWDLKVTSVASNGTIIPIIVAGRVSDLVGNTNTLSGGVDNSVTFSDLTGPSITVEQAVGQADPADSVPIRFTVTFSEKINPATFTAADITQPPTSPNVVWGIASSDNKVFTLTAISSGYGTLQPSIAAGRVTDIFGNLNPLQSTSIDNTVTYVQVPATRTPTPTATPPQVPFKSVVISEVAWMGSAASSSDEWIELFNTTDAAINLQGWHLRTFRWSGTATNGQWVLNLDIVFTATDIIQPRTIDDPKSASGYFLLERGFNSTDDEAVKGIDADKIYTSFLMTDSGEVMLLCSKQNMAAGVCEVNNKNQLVDYVNASWTGSGSSNPWPAGKGSSLYGTMERANIKSDEDDAWFTHTANPPRYGHDRNWNGINATQNLINGTPKHQNWAAKVTATPRATVTPTRTRTPAAAAAPLLVINEVLARAGSDWNNDGKVDVYDEFIEVMNSGSINVNLNTFKLDDSAAAGSSSPFTFPSQTLKPGEKAVFYASQTGIRLEDSGDTVRLLRGSNNTLVDSVTYPIAKTVDISVCRYTDGYGSWLTNCFPTPGRPNALAGNRTPSTVGGALIPVCFLPDTVPDEFVLAECGEQGPGIWNYGYWNSFPGEGTEIWQVDPHDKWLVIYQ